MCVAISLKANGRPIRAKVEPRWTLTPERAIDRPIVGRALAEIDER